MSAPRILSIPPGADFLPTLIEALLSGRLVEGFSPGSDPLALAATTIWVPTRRAVRTLQDAFCERLGRDGAILPDIRALGDGDEEGLAFSEAGADRPGAPDLAHDRPAVGATARQLTLTRLVHAWTRTLEEGERAPYGDADIMVPSSLSDAVGFAAELAELMDTVATEEADWSRLAAIGPQDADLAVWWQLTLRFLSIASRAWPAHLAEHGLADASALRIAGLRRQAEAYAAQAGTQAAPGFLSPFAARPGPVIAAGSTGSIPATAALLGAIARMPTGAVVLPGLDRDMGDDEWDLLAGLADATLDEADRATLPAHPQYGLARLVAGMRATRRDVLHLDREGELAAGLRARETLLSRAMRPSGASAAWNRIEETADDAAGSAPLDEAHAFAALAGVAVIDAPDERTQALAIAFALRETLATTDTARAALVTPDRVLARRVASELRRFSIACDDSAGTPLPNRPAGRFARLVVRLAHAGAGGLGRAPRAIDPLVLVSLVKDPKARFGLTPSQAAAGARTLELAAINGAIQPLRPGVLAQGLARARQDFAQASHPPASVDRLSDEDWEAGSALAARLDALFGPPTDRDADTPVPFAGLVRETVALIEECARDDTGAMEVYRAEDGEVLAGFLSDLLAQDEPLAVESGEWPAVFERLMAPQAVRPRGGTHPRVTILGPIEARLQRFDRIVLGGLQEGVWPQGTAPGAFLSRPMRDAVGLPAPERRIGLAAHDIATLGCGPDVVLSQSLRSAGGPTVPSRFLQRLTMQAGEKPAQAMRARGRRFVDWALAVDTPAKDETISIDAPQPRPPVAVRPTKVSVTEVERWVADPYQIYARNILGLSAMNPPEASLAEPDARVRGTVLHEIMEAYSRAVTLAEAGDEAAEIARLMALAEASFARHGIPAHTAAAWSARVRNFARDASAWHLDRLRDGAVAHIECGGRLQVTPDLTLTARADRIEVLPDGRARIYDLKAGGTPPLKDAREGSAPQLGLTAYMVTRGGFRDPGERPVALAGYVRLADRGQFKGGETIEPRAQGAKPDQPCLDELMRLCVSRLTAYARAFRDPQRAYTPQWRPPNAAYASDYDHLARTGEWALTPDAD